MDKQTELSKAVQTLITALKEDEGYRRGWNDNIAMSFKDEFYRTNPNLKETSDYELHIIANKASENFLNLLCS